ncbi:MAG TPA: hypothetical protein VLL52_10185 [Anaerolineae bacterium]|nr:hypothetical protein [Anaerolineae bacterium]
MSKERQEIRLWALLIMGSSLVLIVFGGLMVMGREVWQLLLAPEMGLVQEAAEDWLMATYNHDFVVMKRLVCEEKLVEIETREVEMAASLLFTEGLEAAVTAEKLANVNYYVMHLGWDEAKVQVTGDIWGEKALMNREPVIYYRMVFEDNQWKWCGGY